MPARARMRVTDEREAEEGVFVGADLGEPPADPDQDRAYEEFRAQSEQEKAGMTTWVYMVPQNERGEPNINTRMEFLFSAPIDQFTLDEIFRRVQADFMGPTDQRWIIRVQVRKPGRNGVMMNNIHPVRALPKGARSSPTGQPQPEGGLAEVLKSVQAMIEANARREDERYARLIEHRPQADSFSARDFIQFMTASQDKTMGQFTAMVQALAGSRGGGTESAQGIGAIISTIRDVKKLSDEMGGGNNGGGDDSTIGLVKALAPPVTSLLELLKQNKVPVAAQPMLPPIPGPTPGSGPTAKITAVPPPPPQEIEAAMFSMLKSNLETIANAAAAGADAKMVAGKVLENLPEQFDESLYALLSAPDWFARLIAIQPAVSAHQEWMGKLRAEIIASFDEETPAA